MVDVTPFLPGLSPVQGKAVVSRFDGGRLSSEGGLLALREIESRLGLADRLAACVKDPRAPERVVHRLAEIIRFRMLMIAAGYEDGNDADSLRADPMFKLALDRLPSDEELCSQSTISRLENLPDTRALLRLGRALIEQYCVSFRQVPKRIVLDIDDTFDRVHGGQQLRLFNAFHDDYGFQPIVVFDGEGRFKRRSDGVVAATIVFENHHPTLSLGMGKPRGRYQGTGSDQYVFKSIEVELSALNPARQMIIDR